MVTGKSMGPLPKWHAACQYISSVSMTGKFYLKPSIQWRIFNMRYLKTTFIAVASIAIIGFAINAFAHGGMGRGYRGQGWCGQYGNGYNQQLTQEEYQQLQDEREAFFKDTEGLRNNLFEKRQALQNELAKEQPDTTKASKLQKEISDLQAQFDQKRIDHMIKMRKVNPNAGRGFMRGGGSGMGYGSMMGRGYGHMMGYGPGTGTGGYCW